MAEGNVLSFTRDMVHRLRTAARRPSPGVASLSKNPYALPAFPPGVAPPGFANDSAVEARATWANDDASLNLQASGTLSQYNLAWANGYGFLGYSYLAQLSQVSEYRQLVGTTAEELTREWGEIKATGDGKSEKVKRLTQILNDDLGMQEQCKAYAEQDGYFGVGHLYLDTGDTDDLDALTKSIGDGRDKISLNALPKLKAVRPVEALWCYPDSYDTTNPLRENWYKPQQWYVNGIRTHATRLLTGSTRPVPDILKPAYAFGGLALTQLAKPYVENWIRTRQSVADLIWRFTVNVLATDLSTLLQTSGAADDILNRVNAMNAVMNNNGTLVINKGTEDWKNVSAPIAGLHELQAQAQEQQAAPGRTPLVKLLGITPSGLNASSDGELRVYYDTIRGVQKSLLTPIIKKVLDFAQLTEYGFIDPEITWEWHPLMQLDAERKATLQKTRADTHSVYVELGAITPEEVRTALSADPESPYSGLDLDETQDEGGSLEDGEAEAFGTELAEHIHVMQTGTPAERLAAKAQAIA